MKKKKDNKKMILLDKFIKKKMYGKGKNMNNPLITELSDLQKKKQKIKNIQSVMPFIPGYMGFARYNYF